MIHSPCGSFAAEMGRMKANRTATRRNRFAMNFGAALFMQTPFSATGGWRNTLPRFLDGVRAGLALKRVPAFHSHIDLVADQIFDRLTLANRHDLVSAHQCLSRQRARIVIGRHDKSIGARAHDRQ